MAVLSLNPGAKQAGGQRPAPNEAQHFRASENVAHPMGRETRVSETGGPGTGRVRDGRELGTQHLECQPALWGSRPCLHAFPGNSNSRPTHSSKVEGIFQDTAMRFLNCGTIRTLWVPEGQVGVTRLKGDWTFLSLLDRRGCTRFLPRARDSSGKIAQGSPHGALFNEDLSLLNHSLAMTVT